jgi:hypothetical protein
MDDKAVSPQKAIELYNIVDKTILALDNMLGKTEDSEFRQILVKSAYCLGDLKLYLLKNKIDLQ